MKKGRSEPRKEKVEEVEKLARLISEYPIVGIINIYKVPTSAFQKLKNEISDIAKIKVSKKSLMKLALEKSGEKSKLIEYLTGQPALIFSKENPFKLSKILDKNKSSVPAKPGDRPNEDIVVRAGPTDIPPGPAISTLSKVGIPAKVEGGKIAILKDKVVCKAGEEVSEDLAAALNLLKIEPIEIGLEIEAVWENGMIFTKDVLKIDEEKTLNDIITAVKNMINLSVNAGWPTKLGIEIMITKAFLNAKSLGLEANIIDKGIIEDILAKAKMHADAIKSKIGGN